VKLFPFHSLSTPGITVESITLVEFFEIGIKGMFVFTLRFIQIDDQGSSFSKSLPCRFREFLLIVILLLSFEKISLSQIKSLAFSISKYLLKYWKIELRLLWCNNKRHSVVFVAFNDGFNYFLSLIFLYFRNESTFNLLISLFLFSYFFSLLFE